MQYQKISFACVMFNIFTGLFYQNEICADVEGIKSKETFCPKGYLELQNTRILFEPEREECSDIYSQTKQRLMTDCENVADSHTCLFDLSTDIRSQPECFQLYEYRIQHTCDGKQTFMVYIFINFVIFHSRMILNPYQEGLCLIFI